MILLDCNHSRIVGTLGHPRDSLGCFQCWPMSNCPPLKRSNRKGILLLYAILQVELLLSQLYHNVVYMFVMFVWNLMQMHLLLEWSESVFILHCRWKLELKIAFTLSLSTIKASKQEWKVLTRISIFFNAPDQAPSNNEYSGIQKAETRETRCASLGCSVQLGCVVIQPRSHSFIYSKPR